MSKMSEFAAALYAARQASRRTDEAFEKEFLQRYIRGLKPLPKKDNVQKQPINNDQS